MNDQEFVKFPKIARLSRPVIVTEKIDGTNSQILISEEGDLHVGSRKRWLTVEKDNFGFCAWAMEHADELIHDLGPGRHFGEWWGQGIQRKYGLDEKRFSLFNVYRWREDASSRSGLPEDMGRKQQLCPPCCHVVPVLAILPGMPDAAMADAWLRSLRETGSRAAPGFMNPEGLVFCHFPSGHLYKKTFEGDEAGKGQVEREQAAMEGGR